MPRGINPRHKVQIVSGKSVIEGWLPERFEMNVMSEWRTPLMGAVSSGSAADLVAAAFGVSKIADWMTVAVWSGSAPLELELPLEFIAEEEGTAQLEVMNPLRALNKLALPGRFDNTFLKPPGPKPIGLGKVPLVGKALESQFGEGEGEIININIGKFLKFRRVILLQVTTSIPAIVDSRGVPMRANALIRFRSFDTPDKAEIDRVFTYG